MLEKLASDIYARTLEKLAELNELTELLEKLAYYIPENGEDIRWAAAGAQNGNATYLNHVYDMLNQLGPKTKGLPPNHPLVTGYNKLKSIASVGRTNQRLNVMNNQAMIKAPKPKPMAMLGKK